MKNKAFAALLCLCGPIALAQSPFDTLWAQLDTGLQVSMLLQNLKGEVLYERNAAKQVPSASVIKIHILTAFFQEVDEGRIRLKDSYVLKEEDIVGGAGTLQREAPGTRVNYYDLADKMIVGSDNVATNILIETIGMAEINKRMASWGMTATQLNRMMMDFEAIRQGRQNYISAQDANRMLMLLYKGKLLSRKSKKAALDMLLRCADAEGIPAGLPAGVRVAHKTGTLDYVRGDAGIILSRNKLVLSVFVEGFSSREQADAVIAGVAALAYRLYGE